MTLSSFVAFCVRRRDFRRWFLPKIFPFESIFNTEAWRRILKGEILWEKKNFSSLNSMINGQNVLLFSSITEENYAIFFFRLRTRSFGCRSGTGSGRETFAGDFEKIRKKRKRMLIIWNSSNFNCVYWFVQWTNGYRHNATKSDISSAWERHYYISRNQRVQKM